MQLNLLTTANHKTPRGQVKGYLTGILYLAPHTTVSKRSLCPHSTPGCRAVCLYSAGRGKTSKVKAGRRRKTEWFLQDRTSFMTQLVWDIGHLARRASRVGMLPAIRLNGTSDVWWETIPVEYVGETYPNIMAVYPSIQFYDYMKTPAKFRQNPPPNYDLTFSIAETLKNREEAERWLRNGGRASAVVDKGVTSLMGYPVIDGDEDDLIFLKPRQVILGLKPKGYALNFDQRGFVIHNMF